MFAIVIVCLLALAPCAVQEQKGLFLFVIMLTKEPRQVKPLYPSQLFSPLTLCLCKWSFRWSYWEHKMPICYKMRLEDCFLSASHQIFKLFWHWCFAKHWLYVCPFQAIICLRSVLKWDLNGPHNIGRLLLDLCPIIVDLSMIACDLHSSLFARVELKTIEIEDNDYSIHLKIKYRNINELQCSWRLVYI
jgi:hypothetical protein